MDRRAVAREDAERRQCLPYESQQSNKLRLLIPFLYSPLPATIINKVP